MREQSARSQNDPAEEADRAEPEQVLPSIGLYDDGAPTSDAATDFMKQKVDEASQRIAEVSAELNRGLA